MYPHAGSYSIFDGLMYCMYGDERIHIGHDVYIDRKRRIISYQGLGHGETDRSHTESTHQDTGQQRLVVWEPLDHANNRRTDNGNQYIRKRVGNRNLKFLQYILINLMQKMSTMSRYIPGIK